MERPFDPSRPPDVSRPSQDIDPWNEFLSESSEELQQLQSEHASTTEDARVDPASAAAEIVPFHREALEPPTPPPPAYIEPVISPAVSFLRPVESDTAPVPLPPVLPSVPMPRVFASSADLAHGLALQEVLRRQTPLHWAEAVAVVEGLCAVLEPEGEPAPIPDLNDILITAGGHVVIRPGATGNPDVVTLGRTLHALLATTTTPVPLRLFVTSSTSSDRFSSVALYAEALSYYAAPGREELIRALYQRALESKAVAPPVPREEPVALTPVIPPVAPKPAAQARPRVPTWAIAAGVGVMIGTSAAVWVWQGTPLDSSPARVVADQEATAAAATPAVEARDDWQLGRVTVGKLVPPPAPVSAANRPATRAAAVPRDVETRQRVMPPVTVESAPLPTTSSSPASQPVQPIPVPAAPPVARATVSAPSVSRPAALPALPESRPVATVGDATIYSLADRDVRPPVMLSRQMLPPLPASSTDSRLDSTIELIIDPTGNVQSVRLLERPTRLPDMNILQAAKYLKFSPAIKDGQPVTYRYQLHQTVTPR